MAGAIPTEELYFFVVEIVSLHIDTAEKYWEKSQIRLRCFFGTPYYTACED